MITSPLIKNSQATIVLPSSMVNNDTARIKVNQSLPLHGTAQLVGAKNAVFASMCCLILTSAISILRNIPCSADVYAMIEVLTCLGALIEFNETTNTLQVDTRAVNRWQVDQALTHKTRGSFLLAGALLGRFGTFSIGLPGGDAIGKRPIDYHLKAFVAMGASLEYGVDSISAQASLLKACRIVFEYPSVGATQNSIMASVLTPGTTVIINAAFEPEIFDFIKLLNGMGACIEVQTPATLVINGVSALKGADYSLMDDRLEAGTLLLAAAITGGSIDIPQADPNVLEIFLVKLQQMGHTLIYKADTLGISLRATLNPQAVCIKTAPYPGFPTDLQAPMVAALSMAQGISTLQETVYENRFLYAEQLNKMGADIKQHGDTLIITGVKKLYGASVVAGDIRASAALVLAGLAAQGTTLVDGMHHWRRGYQYMEEKLNGLGSCIEIIER